MATVPGGQGVCTQPWLADPKGVGEWCKSDQRPTDIPTRPDHTYEDEWQDMGDWLGTGSVAHKNRKWRPFEEARAFVRELGLGNAKDWQEWCKSGHRPMDIPTRPHKTYEDKGWQSWPDWLGTGYRPFGEAREFARRLGLQGGPEWKEWCKSGQKPKDIPANPDRVYEDKGWQDWGDWLGTGNIHPSNKEWRPFEEAREFMRGLGLRDRAEWRKWCKSDQRPKDIPTNPAKIYKGRWRGIADWLGYTPLRWDRDAILTFLEDLRPHLAYLEEKE